MQIKIKVKFPKATTNYERENVRPMERNIYMGESELEKERESLPNTLLNIDILIYLNLKYFIYIIKIKIKIDNIKYDIIIKYRYNIKKII